MKPRLSRDIREVREWVTWVSGLSLKKGQQLLRQEGARHLGGAAEGQWARARRAKGWEVGMKSAPEGRLWSGSWVSGRWGAFEHGHDVTWQIFKDYHFVAVWSIGGDQIGSSRSHTDVAWGRDQRGRCTRPPPIRDRKSEEPGKRHRKVVLAGKKELDITRQRQWAEAASVLQRKWCQQRHMWEKQGLCSRRPCHEMTGSEGFGLCALSPVTHLPTLSILIVNWGR